MRKHSSKTCLCPALTLIETVMSLAIMAIIFAVLLPQIRVIQNSWDSNVNGAEALQNGRVLIEHMKRNVSKAVKITAVSDSSETNGYIEFQDSAANVLRYDISADNNVEFGIVGNLSELAGPVSQLQFTCYDGNDFNTSVVDANSIRFIKAQTTLTKSAGMDQDITLVAHIYLRTSGSAQGAGISMASPFEFDTAQGITPALARIDSTHYLCAYSGDRGDGWAVVLTADTGTGQVTKETPFEFDSASGVAPALVQIDSTHYLCAYQGRFADGWAVVLTIDTGTWQITSETPFEYDSADGAVPALAQIDPTHYLCVYQGPGSDGWAVVLTVDTGTWQITKETPFEFDTLTGENPALAQIDATHYLCAYQGNDYDGWAVVLTVDTGTWQIAKDTPFEYDAVMGMQPALTKIDSTHFLCAYRGPGDAGWAVVLTVNAGTWQITKETPFEFDNVYGDEPSMAQADPNDYLCAYAGPDSHGWVTVLTADRVNWEITRGTPFEYDIVRGTAPALAPVDPNNYLCAYHGPADDGWTVVLRPGSDGGLLP